MTKKWLELSQENPKIPPGYYLARITQLESYVSTWPETHGVRAYGMELALYQVDLEQLRQGPVEGADTKIKVCMYISPSAAAEHLRETFERFFFIEKDHNNLGKTGLIYIGKTSRKISPIDEEHGILIYLRSLRQMNGLREPPVQTSEEENLVLPMGEIQRHLCWLKHIVQEETARIVHQSPDPKDLKNIAYKIESATNAVCHYVHTGQWLLGPNLREEAEGHEPE